MKLNEGSHLLSSWEPSSFENNFILYISLTYNTLSLITNQKTKAMNIFNSFKKLGIPVISAFFFIFGFILTLFASGSHYAGFKGAFLSEENLIFYFPYYSAFVYFLYILHGCRLKKLSHHTFNLVFYALGIVAGIVVRGIYLIILIFFN